MDVLITLCAAALGGMLLEKCKVTGGAILGAIFAAAIVNIATGNASLPPEISIVAKIGTGAFIGTKIRKRDLIELRRVILPTLMLLGSFILYNLLSGFILNGFAGLDIRTALLATAPGGLAEMTLAGEDLGAQSSIIAAVQVCRLFSIALVLPLIIKGLLKRMEKKGADIHSHKPFKANNDTGINIKADEIVEEKGGALNTALTLICATAGGLLGHVCGIPAATVSFAMIAACALNVTTGRACLPISLRQGLLILNGAIAGARITVGDIKILGGLTLPLLVVLAGYMALNVGLGLLLSKRAGLGLSTSLFATAPGGMPEMTLMAETMGGDTAKVAAMQITRNVTVVSIFPILISTFF